MRKGLLLPRAPLRPCLCREGAEVRSGGPETDAHSGVHPGAEGTQQMPRGGRRGSFPLITLSRGVGGHSSLHLPRHWAQKTRFQTRCVAGSQLGEPKLPVPHGV